jgi:hypothetical protein
LRVIAERILYMHDGASAHFSHPARDDLNNTYHGRWIGRGGPTVWCPRSPDFNPLDFYLWGHIKTPEYAAPVDNEESLHHRSVDACQTIRNFPGIFERMRRSMMRRVETWSESHGGHFEYLLYAYSFSYNPQIKCFRTHVDMDTCFGVWNSYPNFSVPYSHSLHMHFNNSPIIQI